MCAQAAEWSNVFSDVEMSSDSGALSSRRNLEGMDAIELDELGDKYKGDVDAMLRAKRGDRRCFIPQLQQLAQHSAWQSNK